MSKTVLLCPSMMCADFSNMKEEVIALQEAGADMFHIDVMDGIYVPNYGMSPQDIQAIRKHTKALIDVHLMTLNPGQYVEMFANLGADVIYIHPEAEYHPARTLDKIKKLGIKAGIVVDPGVSIASMKELLWLADFVMIMTVNPGFAGQSFLEYTKGKITELIDYKKQYDFQIIADGAISPDIIQELSAIGVDGFILGTSSLFGKGKPYHQIMQELRAQVKV